MLQSLNRNLKSRVFLITLLVLGCSLFSGFFLYTKLFDNREREILDIHDNRQAVISELMLREIGDLETLVRLIYADDSFVSGLQDESGVNRVLVAEVFSRFGLTAKNFLQVRWVDDQGLEQVRVNFSGQEAISTESSQLQDKSGRYYVEEAKKVVPPDIYISPVDLNVEKGEIVEPYQPTLRVAIQTGVEGSLPKGLLVVNYNLGPRLKQMPGKSDDVVQSQILNPEGFWLLHYQKDKEWGRDLGHNSETLKKQNPMLWAHIQGSQSAVGERLGGALISHRRLQLSSDLNQNKEFLYVVTETPKAVIDGLKWQALEPALYASLAVLLLGGYCVLWEYRTRMKMTELALQLSEEKKQLLKVNKDLDRALAEQQSLQDDLVQNKRLASLGMTVAGVAHELNTPIGGAQLAISGLQQKIKELKQALEAGLTRSALDGYVGYSEEGVQMSMANLQRANAVIRSFKRFSSDRINGDVIEFPLQQLVEDLQLSLKPKLKSHHTTLVNRVSPDLSLKSDPGLLSQVLENLIMNALSHGFKVGQGGTVWIDACQLEDKGLEIHVQDDGRGVAPEIRGREFDPFVTSGRGQGHTGLGLHLVHQWVTTQLGGSIYCAEPDGEGALFVIRLPLVI